MKHVVIVGGGIAGLGVAWALRGRAKVTIVEKERLGGTIRTVRENGFLIEGGPDSFISYKPWAAQLCRELGLGSELMPAKARRVYVWSEGSFHELPEGFFLTVPTKVAPMLKSKLLSWKGKLRMGLDLFLPRGKDQDESLGAFVRRRFGKEALEKIAEPLMAGIFVAEADRLSLKSTFPRFQEMERASRSLIRAMRNVPATGTSPFTTIRDGMSRMVERLVEKLGAETVTREVRRIEPGFRVVMGDGEIQADRVVVATPAPITARLLGAWPELSRAVAEIPYVSTVTVSLGYRAKDVARELDGTGFVIPRAEKRGILACTWTSSKFDYRAPEGSVLIRCFLVGEPEDPVGIARAEMRDLMGITAEPAISKSFRWPETNPIYEVGHAERVEKIDKLVPAGLALAGAGYRGIGIPDNIQDANRVGQNLLQGL